MEEQELIKACRNGERKAQNLLFHKYAPLMLSICMRYMKNKEVAEDILVHGFYKVLTKLDSYKEQGSFEGWIKRIIVNECLMELRKKKSSFLTVAIEEMHHHPLIEWENTLEYEELLALLDELPNGYRTVFNMYVIEGFKHKEIAEKLDISINTSKSQLILARRKLQQLIKKKYRITASA